MNSWFSFGRLFALLNKEFIQMRRDRVTFAMMLGIPLIQLILFGYAINNDPRHLPAALVSVSQDHYSRSVITALELTGYYRFDYIVTDKDQADRLLETGDVSFVVSIPSDFATKIARNDSPQILVEVDATDPAVASGAVSALNDAINNALIQEQHQSTAIPLVNVVVHKRYNPEGITQYNIVPGLLGVILQMTMVMMTSMALTRETERGTMENLLSMPVTPMEIMLGKVLPYLVIGAVQVAVILIAAKLLFSVPFLGSLMLLLSAVLLFVMSLVLLGYTISTVVKTQMQAMQLTFFYFLPSLLLSGFMFPYRGMPVWAQYLGELFPLTHFLRVIRGIMLKGAGYQSVYTEMIALALFIVVFMSIALLRFRKTLD